MIKSSKILQKGVVKNMFKVNENYFYYIQTSNLTVISDSLEWTLDGEFGGIYDKVEIQNCNNAIEIITPVSKSLKQIFTS